VTLVPNFRRVLKIRSSLRLKSEKYIKKVFYNGMHHAQGHGYKIFVSLIYEFLEYTGVFAPVKLF
jgi:hypothetical protein